MSRAIRLGDKVRDTISGFEGIAVARTEWLTGCVRWMIEPDKLDKEKKVQGCVEFDESRLVVVKAQPIPQLTTRDAGLAAQQPGGPTRTPSQRQSPRRR